MELKTVKFSVSSTQFYFGASMSHLKKIARPASSVIITDEHLFDAHPDKFRGYNTIVLKPGEEHKVQDTVSEIIEQLVEMQADRQTTLVGVGGGVVTDITGYTASVYMRGLKFGFVPTSILGLVDASIGGKNGVDLGDYKNMVGTIRQPSFILHDYSLLASLPDHEWVNGFAEVIKHACITDAAMFRELEKHTVADYRRDKKLVSALIRRNTLIKTKVVQGDEFEKGDRRLLNFGHTLGHAVETQYELSHGEAISIGMTAACQLSEQLTGFKHTAKVTALLGQYGLPTYAAFDRDRVTEVMTMDKKRDRKEMNYVLLSRIGKGVVKAIPLKQLGRMIRQLD
ncbi:MAG: 3-dehydroquinate synthase [Chitinophagaceae bacterium]|nr:MAG: 3-dehydroquinate synthase [Chitinophagaceae bacterium]